MKLYMPTLRITGGCKRACQLCGQDAACANKVGDVHQPAGLEGCVRLGRSLRSLPRLTPPQFASHGLASQALIRAGKPLFTTGNVKQHTRKIGLSVYKSIHKIVNSYY